MSETEKATKWSNCVSQPQKKDRLLLLHWLPSGWSWFFDLCEWQVESKQSSTVYPLVSNTAIYVYFSPNIVFFSFLFLSPPFRVLVVALSNGAGITSCPSPDPPDNSHTACGEKQNKIGSVVQFRCNWGYRFVGTTAKTVTATCDCSGWWKYEPVVPRCEGILILVFSMTICPNDFVF